MIFWAVEMDMMVRRRTGAYYTCPTAAEKITERVLRRSGMKILEPSFGSGVFLRSIRDVAERLHGGNVRLVGAEISRIEYQRALQCARVGDEFHFGDFMTMPVQQVDAVIGNPPYIRLRHLSPKASSVARSIASKLLGSEIAESASLWMPFVLRSLQFLGNGGSLSLVVPFEITHVKYAKSLWGVLCRSFSEVRLIRVGERIFPEILQDVVVLQCSGFGGSCKDIEFEIHDSLSGYLSDTGADAHRISLDGIQSGSSPFSMALLHGHPALKIADRVSSFKTKEICKFSVGYVAGDKEFFHPTEAVRRRFRLPRASLRPAVASSRSIKCAGLLASGINSSLLTSLFLPNGDLSPGETRYVKHGELMGINEKYKCRVRRPWYVVPGVKVPDFLMGGFADIPIMLVNDVGLVSSNSLLGGNLSAGFNKGDFVASWYTSLTLLDCEMKVHSLGGGVMILIPGEVDNICVPYVPNVDSAALEAIDSALRSGDVDAAYRVGDEFVLRRKLGLRQRDVDEIRDAVNLMRSWRMRKRSHMA